MKAPAFSYVRPRSLAQVFDLLDMHGDDARILAGGQSLLATLNLRLSAPAVLVDIGGLALSGIRQTARGLEIGALTTHREVEASPLVAQLAPLLREAMPHVAHVAIRNRGTMGGSLALADPSAEWPACVVALGARIVVQGRNGRRTIDARKFFLGLYETALQPGELVVSAEFDAPKAGHRYFFGELARRHGDYAAVGLAGVAHAEAGSTVSDLSLVFFGAGVTPVLLPVSAEQCRGLGPNALRDEVLHQVDATLAPLADLHFSSAAKHHLSRVLAARAVAHLTRAPA